MPAFIVVVTGASGAGKTSTVKELAARGVPGVQCFHFDSAGVPAIEIMERNHGSAEQWQASMTNHWLARLAALGSDVRVAVLDAQTRPSTVFAAPGAGEAWRAHVILFDCSAGVRAERLRGPRGQPELVDARMDQWAAYLRHEADTLSLPVIDTSHLTVVEAADRLQALVLRLAAPGVSTPNAAARRLTG